MGQLKINGPHIQRGLAIGARLLVAALLLAGCAHVEKDCHLAAITRQASLPAGAESRLLFIERTSGEAHVWLIYRDRKGWLWCWDQSGSQPLHIKDFIEARLMTKWVEGAWPKRAYYD